MSKVALTRSEVAVERREDGSILLRSQEALKEHAPRIFDRVLNWGERDPDRVALADRHGAENSWRRVTYAEFADQTARLGQALLDAGLGRERPLMLVSENRIEAALLTYAAYRAGVPVAPITPAYSAGTDRSRLTSIVTTLQPGMVVAESLAVHGAALSQVLEEKARLVSLAEEHGATSFSGLLATQPRAEFSRAERAVSPDDHAKILFTSGSTGTPKGAINTHRMLASNAQTLRQAWPFVEGEPPIIVDWLPWNHTFGGNFVLNLALGAGGSLFIDDGKPLPGLIQRSVANSAEVRPTIHVNAPRGLEMVARVLAASPDLAERFFERLGLIFFASAGLPERIRADWMRLIERYATRPVAFCSAWGTTETAPLATVLNFDADQINNIGVPAIGTTIKLAPFSGRYELRVKGPNVTPGYLGRDDLTNQAFDEEGYFKTGDAGCLANPENPDAGLLIEGRLAEDFKLSSGVWVSVSGLRGQLLEHLGPLVRDVVISGPQRDELAALVFLDLEQAQKLADAQDDYAVIAEHPTVRDHVRSAIDRHNQAGGGSSRRIVRFRIMPRPLDPAAGELTEKGTVNQALLMKRESSICDALHAPQAEPAR